MTNPTARSVVAFDFDGTLTHRDTLVPFLRRAVGGPKLIRGLTRSQLAWRFGGQEGRNRAKRALLISTLNGVSANTLAAVGVTYAAHLLEHEIRADVFARLAVHKQQGHRIVLVSASLGYYLDPLATRLGIDDVLCCRPSGDGQGISTGVLDRPNLRGAAKVHRLAELLGSDPVLAYAYGNDAKADGPMLALANTPVLVDQARLPPITLGGINPVDPISGPIQLPCGTINT